MVDLTNKEIFEAIKAQGQLALTTDQVEEAFAFVRNIEKLMAAPENQGLAEDPDMVEEYLRLADRLSFVALPSLRDDEAVGLFLKDALTGLRETSVDIVAKVRAHLLTISAFESRDILRKRLREALAANGQRLGTDEIVVGSAKEGATLGGWIRKYDKQFGTGEVDVVKRSQFLVTDKDIQKLSELEKFMVRRLFELYEYLKLSSQTPEGMEDPVLFEINGQKKVLSAGEWEEVKLPEHIEKIVSESVKFFETGTALAGGINMAEIGRSSREQFIETGGDAAKLATQLEASFASEHAEEGLAVLLLLAQLRKLDDLIEDARFAKLVTDDLKKGGHDDMLSGMVASPTAPQYLSRLLKVIMEDRLGLSHQDAIAFGSRLTRILALEGEKYQSIIKNGKWNL